MKQQLTMIFFVEIVIRSDFLVMSLLFINKIHALISGVATK